MKSIFKQVSLFIVSASLLNPIFAASSGAYYGTPNKLAMAKEGYFSVTVHNYTGYTYTAQSTYYPSSKTERLTVGTAYPYNTLTFVDRFPDNQICLSITRDFDNYPIVGQCFTSGQNINIGPYLAANKVPAVKFVQ